MMVGDNRLPPFSWQSRGAMRRLRARTPERSLTSTRSVYVALCELASDAGDGKQNGFAVAKKQIASTAGVSVRTADACVAHLVEIGLVSMTPSTLPDGRTTTPVYALESGGATIAPPAVGDVESAGLARGGDVQLQKKEEGTPSTPSSSRKKILSAEEEHPAFSEWLGYHCVAAGRSVPRAGTSARSTLARTFAALVVEEGYSLEEMKLATDGVLGDEWMVAQGHTKPENVLRKEKIAGRIEDGRKLAARPVGKYDHLSGGVVA